MKHILQFDELENNGEWSIFAPKELGKIGNQWYTPARALNMELKDYVSLIITKFNPDNIKFSIVPKNGLLLFSWHSQAKMRLFKNWLNKEMRHMQFYVD